MRHGHSCLRASARADRNVCPTLPRSITAASRDGVAPPVLARFCGNFPSTRPPSTPVDPIDPHRGLRTTAAASATAYCHCLLILPVFPSRASVPLCLCERRPHERLPHPPLPTATAYCLLPLLSPVPSGIVTDCTVFGPIGRVAVIPSTRASFSSLTVQRGRSPGIRCE